MALAMALSHHYHGPSPPLFQFWADVGQQWSSLLGRGSMDQCYRSTLEAVCARNNHKGGTEVASHSRCLRTKYRLTVMDDSEPNTALFSAKKNEFVGRDGEPLAFCNVLGLDALTTYCMVLQQTGPHRVAYMYDCVTHLPRLS